ncbi:hypothetical protein P4233_16770 [Pseudomonas aeruginosa]|nr:hypothetical protein [Pseudomonas aeruginosa]
MYRWCCPRPPRGDKLSSSSIDVKRLDEREHGLKNSILSMTIKAA